MSLWGETSSFDFNHLEFKVIPITLKQNFQFSTTSINNGNSSVSQIKDSQPNLIEKLIGFLDGDGYFDIGPQKQYNKDKDPNNQPRSTIRIRFGVNLQIKDKELLELIVTNLGVGKIDYSKSNNQYRLIFYQKDILNVIYPYIKNNNIEFLIYNRQKQFFLYKYILENKIKYWDNLNLEEINKLFKISHKKLEILDIINLPYFKNWLVGFTMAEGSFHIKARGTAHFSIVQSGNDNYEIIKAICYIITGRLPSDIKPCDADCYQLTLSSKRCFRCRFSS